MSKTILLSVALIGQTLLFCHSALCFPRQPLAQTSYSKDSTTADYTSENLTIHKLSANTYEHITYLNTDSFGKVTCNGLIVVDNKEAIIFDTPTTNETSEELLNYVTNTLGCTVTAIIPTHFHADCLGGLAAFHARKIPSYASYRTIELAKSRKFTEPQKGFRDTLMLNVGRKKVYVTYFGEGHTTDNVVGYFPDDSILFGGCLIKETGAGKGNLEDANTKTWAATIRKLKAAYPTVKTVVPGHGKYGGTELLDYTIKLFK